MNAPNKPAATHYPPVPDLSDLLVNSLALEDPALAASAAQNALTPVTAGIHAIGDLLTVAADSTERVATDALRDTGFLLMFLADLQGSLGTIINNAHYDLTHSTAREDRK